MTAAFATGQAAGPMLVSLYADAGRSLDTLLLFASGLLLLSVLPLLSRSSGKRSLDISEPLAGEGRGPWTKAGGL